VKDKTGTNGIGLIFEIMNTNYAIKTRVNKLKYPLKLLNNNLQIQCKQFAK